MPYTEALLYHECMLHIHNLVCQTTLYLVFADDWCRFLGINSDLVCLT